MSLKAYAIYDTSNDMLVLNFVITIMTNCYFLYLSWLSIIHDSSQMRIVLCDTSHHFLLFVMTINIDIIEIFFGVRNRMMKLPI